MNDQSLQIAAALMLLAAFGLAQFGLVHDKSLLYLLFNMLGSAVLAMGAWAGHQWGVLILEGSWSLISTAGLAQSISTLLDRPADFLLALWRNPADAEPGRAGRRQGTCR